MSTDGTAFSCQVVPDCFHCNPKQTNSGHSLRVELRKVLLHWRCQVITLHSVITPRAVASVPVDTADERPGHTLVVWFAA